MTIHKKRRTWFSLFAKALFPRFMFLGHGAICIHLLVLQENESRYWYLTFCLGLIVLEGIFNVIVRGGKEFHWFSPSAFLYCVVLIVTMIFLRNGQIQCQVNKSTYCENTLVGNDAITKMFSSWSFSQRASLIEQTGMLILIVGRWLLPQGFISKDQFCQILLIYIGTAADIVEFSEIYNGGDITNLKENTSNVLHGIMAVWGISVIQFSITIALPEEGLKEEEEDEEEEEEEEDDAFEQLSYFRTKLKNKVEPMSYMHYKSLLREGINNKTNDTHFNTQSDRTPPQNQDTFENKYPIFSANNNSMRSKPFTLEPISKGRKRAESNLTFYESQRRPDRISQTSINERYNTISLSSTSTSSKINMPHGSRTPMNIGSPPVSVKSKKSKTSLSNGINKQSIITPQNNRSDITNPPVSTSKRSSKESITSQASRNFQSRESPPIKSWDRVLERIPFSKKRKRNKPQRRKDSTKEDNSLGIGKKEVKSCFYKYLDLIGIMLPVCMQDGPFFIIRFLLIVRYSIVTEMIVLLVIKNALVIIVQIYRVLLMYCSEPEKEEPDGNHPSVRVRAAMNTNQKLSGKTSFRGKRASIAVQALSRMQARLRGEKGNRFQRRSRQRNGDIESGYEN